MSNKPSMIEKGWCPGERAESCRLKIGIRGNTAACNESEAGEGKGGPGANWKTSPQSQEALTSIMRKALCHAKSYKGKKGLLDHLGGGSRWKLTINMFSGKKADFYLIAIRIPRKRDLEQGKKQQRREGGERKKKKDKRNDRRAPGK